MSEEIQAEDLSTGQAVFVIAVTLGFILAWLLFSAALTTVVNMWAVGVGGFFFVWGVNVLLGVLVSAVSFGLRVLAGRL